MKREISNYVLKAVCPSCSTAHTVGNRSLETSRHNETQTKGNLPKKKLECMLGTSQHITLTKGSHERHTPCCQITLIVPNRTKTSTMLMKWEIPRYPAKSIRLSCGLSGHATRRDTPLHLNVGRSCSVMGLSGMSIREPAKTCPNYCLDQTDVPGDNAVQE